VRQFEIRGYILELRIKLEKNLKMILEQHELEDEIGTVKENLNKLKELKLIDIKLYNTAFDILRLGNLAAHDEVSTRDLALAEKLDRSLETMLIESGLLFEAKALKEPSFEELFHGSEFKKEKKEGNEKSSDFGEMLKSFDKEVDEVYSLKKENRPRIDSGIDPAKIAEKHKKLKKNHKTDEKEFEKLLDEFDNEDFED